MRNEKQRQTAEVLSSIAVLKVVQRLQLQYGVPIAEASALVSAVLPKVGKLVELWTRRKE